MLLANLGEKNCAFAQPAPCIKERVFSLAGNVVTPKGLLLKPEMVDMLVFPGEEFVGALLCTYIFVFWHVYLYKAYVCCLSCC